MEAYWPPRRRSSAWRRSWQASQRQRKRTPGCSEVTVLPTPAYALSCASNALLGNALGKALPRMAPWTAWFCGSIIASIQVTGPAGQLIAPGPRLSDVLGACMHVDCHNPDRSSVMHAFTLTSIQRLEDHTHPCMIGAFARWGCGSLRPWLQACMPDEGGAAG